MDNSPENRIRVSCAALCQIEIDGKLLLEINKNRGDVLTPIGGALEFDAEARPFLEGLGANFQKGNDLRLLMPLDRLTAFEQWFRAQRDRETDPLRELREELLDEHKVVSAWPESAMVSKFLRLVEHEAETSRKDSAGTLTRYFYELFEVNLPDELKHACLAATELPGSRLCLLDPDEIIRRSEPDWSSDAGMKAAVTCRFLVESTG